MGCLVFSPARIEGCSGAKLPQRSKKLPAYVGKVRELKMEAGCVVVLPISKMAKPIHRPGRFTHRLYESLTKTTS
jgi:hypothetical protein